MTWFSLPITQADNKAAFFDSDSAARWLTQQPQANAPAMLSGLTTQIEIFNRYRIAPRERFRTMETLRKVIFAVSGECQRRYEHKPLPLLAAEQAVFDTAHQLWRACAVAYLHCLRACLDGDSSIADHGAKVAHRVLSCLRMQQLNGYRAGSELDGEFWRTLHSVLASAQQLNVVRQPIEDRQLGETSESTVGGQYAMVLMLHLACPFALSRGQLSAATLWFARWREQAALLEGPEESAKSCCIALDLSAEGPLCDIQRPDGMARWLSLTGVLRKMRKRLELLAAGESPESLKLGSGLSAEACVAFLNLLSDRLQHPLQAVPEVSPDRPPIAVVAGQENIHRLLGGRGLKASTAPAFSYGNQLSHEQLAVFDHVVRDNDDDRTVSAETWRIAREEEGQLHLSRLADGGAARMALRDLLAVQVPLQDRYSLATISCLCVRHDGNLCVTVSLLAGEPSPLLAEMREKPTGKISTHPAFLLAGAEASSVSSSIILPAGLAARALSMRFFDAREHALLGLRLVNLLERGGDNECWSLDFGP